MKCERRPCRWVGVTAVNAMGGPFRWRHDSPALHVYCHKDHCVSQDRELCHLQCCSSDQSKKPPPRRFFEEDEARLNGSTLSTGLQRHQLWVEASQWWKIPHDWWNSIPKTSRTLTTKPSEQSIIVCLFRKKATSILYCGVQTTLTQVMLENVSVNIVD